MPLNCEQAIAKARDLAAETDEPHVVWRYGDEFGVAADSQPQPFPCPTSPVRPVAMYDPDGTEYA